VLKVETTKLREVVDLTGLVKEFAQSSGIKDGLLFCYNKHTTSALVLANRREGIAQLLHEILQDIAEDPVEKKSATASRDPNMLRAYLLSALMGNSLGIPIESGSCRMGDWQGVYLVEMAGPREREIVLTAVGN